MKKCESCKQEIKVPYFVSDKFCKSCQKKEWFKMKCFEKDGKKYHYFIDKDGNQNMKEGSVCHCGETKIINGIVTKKGNKNEI